MSSTGSLLSSMRPQPPTPPRNIAKDLEDALQFLENGHEEPNAGSNDVTEARTTPTKTNSTTPNEAPTTSKRVDFSHDLIRPSIPRSSSTNSPPTHRNNGSTSSPANKPLKSILKSTSSAPPTPEDMEVKLSYFSPSEPGSYQRMLQSILQMLASPNRSDRLDAYQSINGTLRTYDDVPPSSVIVEKLGILTQFLARDIAWKDNGSLDRTIVIAALSLTTSLMLDPRVSKSFDNDFRSFLLDRTCIVLEQDGIGKDLIKSHIVVLYQQFPANVLTAARVERILKALGTITDRCSGNAIVAARMVVYNSLVRHAPSTMLNRMRDWFEHVLHGTLSSHKDIREKAVETCFYAGLKLGTHPQACKIILEIFERDTDSGLSYVEFFCSRLRSMSRDAEHRDQVPKTWAAITLFFRAKRRYIEQWSRLRIWLTAIQDCLNSGDINLKQHANRAWDTLVFVIMPHADTPQTLRSMLKVPIIVGLERRNGDRNAQHQRQIAMRSYCNLLHYALRPELDEADLRMNWDMYVATVLPPMMKASKQGELNGFRVLSGLLSPNNGSWNVNAANEAEAIKPEDLPGMNAKWIRSRIDLILPLIGPHMAIALTSPTNDTSPIRKCWQALVQAVAEAGSQEIRVSVELKHAIAHLVTFTCKLWTIASSECEESQAAYLIRNFKWLLTCTCNAIGAGNLKSAFLYQNNGDEFDAIAHPVLGTSTGSKAPFSPFAFWARLCLEDMSTALTRTAIDDLLPWIARTVGMGQTSNATSLSSAINTIVECHQIVPQTVSKERCPDVMLRLVQFATECVLAKDADGNADIDLTLDNIRASLGIIRRSIQGEVSTISPNALSNLCKAACDAAKTIAGDGGVILAVMEPLAKALINQASSNPHISHWSQIGSVLMEIAPWPKEREVIAQAHRILGISPLDKTRSAVFSPYEHFFQFLFFTWEEFYVYGVIDSDAGVLSKHDFVKFSTTWCDFMRRCPRPLSIIALSRMQNGLLRWIIDPAKKLFVVSDTCKQSLSQWQAVAHQMWACVVDILSNSATKDSLMLELVEPILSAGMSSPSMFIVSHSIRFWNKTFAEASHLDYPTGLERILRSRRAQTELHLPGLSADLPGADLIDLPSLVDTNEIVVQENAHSPVKQGLPLKSALPALRRSRLTSASPLHKSASAKKSPTKAEKFRPQNLRRKPAKLRHDDSQIDFAQVDTLPSLRQEESQLLTEHQKEVTRRQHEDAQIFPDMSSSPIGAKQNHKPLPRKLDFVDDEERIHVSTPSGLTDTNPMSDDLPASPTPRTPARSVSSQIEARAEEQIVDQDDIPSSPPQQEDAPEMSSDADDIEITAEQESKLPSDELLDSEMEASPPVYDHLRSDDASQEDFHDDTTIVPAAAEEEGQDIHLPREPQSESLLVTSDDNSNAHQETQDPPMQSTSSLADIVEDSFIDPEAMAISSPVSSSPDSQHTGKKRKRPSRPRSVRRKKRANLLQEDSSYSQIVPSSQDITVDDEEMHDEIVVIQRRTASDPSQLSAMSSSPAPPQTTDAPTRRGRGRPRKQSTPAVVTSNVAAPSRKRRAVEEPSMSNKSVRLTRSQSSNDVQDQGTTTSSWRNIDDSLAMRPAVGKVMISRSQETNSVPTSVIKTESGDDEDDDDDSSDVSDDDLPSPEKQLEREHMAAIQERRIAQPKSILGRLRGILSDCKKLVLGSQEERELDDMLFEIRKEVHQAGARGR